MVVPAAHSQFSCLGARVRPASLLQKWSKKEYGNREYRSTLVQFCFRSDTLLNENTRQVGTILLVCYLSLRQSYIYIIWQVLRGMSSLVRP